MKYRRAYKKRSNRRRRTSYKKKRYSKKFKTSYNGVFCRKIFGVYDVETDNNGEAKLTVGWLGGSGIGFDITIDSGGMA